MSTELKKEFQPPVKPELELTLQRLVNQEITTLQFSDEKCRELLSYIILKFRLKF